MSQSVQLKVATEKLVPNLAYAFTSNTTFVKELMQNANRAGSSSVSIWVNENGFVIEDDGVGIKNMQDLLTVAESGWDESVKLTQKPFGIGWLSALFAADWVSVSSNGSTLEGMTADILNFAEIGLRSSSDLYGKPGTRVELRGIKATESQVMAAAKEFAKGFPLPVELNGALLDRPHAVDCANRTWIQTSIGQFSVPGIDKGEVRNVVHLYLQGFSVGKTDYDYRYFRDQGVAEERMVVVHLDPQQFFARLPDREVLIDRESQTSRVEQCYRALWQAHLSSELERMDEPSFLDLYTRAAEKFHPVLFERIPFLPASWLEEIVGVPDVGDHPDETGVIDVTRHISKTEIEEGRVTVVELDDPEVESSDCPLWLYAAKSGFFRLEKKLPTEAHWAYDLLVPLYDWEIEVRGDVISSCHAWLPETGGGTFRLVDQYSLSVTGHPELPTFVVGDETLWAGDGFWIPVGDESPGHVVSKMCDFTDENGSYQDDDAGRAYSRMEAIVLDLKYPNASDILRKLIDASPWRDFPSLRSGPLTFSVTLEEGRVKVTEADASSVLFDGLFSDALEGLKECYPEKLNDSDVVKATREAVRKYFQPSGNQKEDYQRLREAIEAIVK